MRTHTCLGMVLMWSALGAAPLAAQARTDSLEDRLERAEEAIQRLQRELASQAQAKAQPRGVVESGFPGLPAGYVHSSPLPKSP